MFSLYSLRDGLEEFAEDRGTDTLIVIAKEDFDSIMKLCAKHPEVVKEVMGTELYDIEYLPLHLSLNKRRRRK